jgi:hypothetical protein
MDRMPMKKLTLISIGLLLIVATVFVFASAESETTYYIYDNGEWRVCSDAEAIHAQNAMERETPLPLSQDGLNAIFSSREPFWNYYNLKSTTEKKLSTPMPTPTITPSPTWSPAPIPDGYWDSVISNRLPKRNYSIQSKLLNLFK